MSTVMPVMTWSECIVAGICLAISGPTSFPIGIGVVFLLWNVLPLWIFLVVFGLYYVDVIFGSAHLTTARHSPAMCGSKAWQLVINKWLGGRCLVDDRANFRKDRTYIFSVVSCSAVL